MLQISPEACFLQNSRKLKKKDSITRTDKTEKYVGPKNVCLSRTPRSTCKH